jgi:hypothetical protein
MAHSVISVSATVLVMFACGVATGAEVTHVRITGEQFTYNGEVFKIKGTNYYPQDHMWADMWTSWNWSAIQHEINLISDLGMNAVRILVPYSNGGWGGRNVPASRLKMLEDLVNAFGEAGIRSCVTLFDWETSFPEAGTSRESDHIAHLNAIVMRLRNNPYVLCWDVKNEPDHPSNIGGHDNWDNNPSKRNQIVSWLQRMCNAVRQRDPNHPVSAGLRWWQNVQDVIHFVDIAMFHSYWPNIDQQITDTKGYMGANKKPILVEEWGWPSNPSPGYNGGVLTTNFTETDQLAVYQNHLPAFEAHDIAGGLQWMTFDAGTYSTDPNESFERHFGLWRYGYALKPAGIYYRDNFLVEHFPIEPDVTPPGVVTNLKISVSNSKVMLTWAMPDDRDVVGAVVRYSTTSTPLTPNDGILLADVPGIMSSGASVTHLRPRIGTMHYYAVFAHDNTPNYAPGAFISAKTLIPGDFDQDGDIDMIDFGRLQGCISGLGTPQNRPECQSAKLDPDDDVDSDDLRLFTACISGSNVPVDPDCAE